MASRRRHSSVVLNLTPLIDVVFLLLVFFMLTAHFVDEQAMVIDLPSAASGAEVTEDPYVNVEIGADGSIMIDGQQVLPSQLESQIGKALEQPEKHKVRLRGDTEMQFGLAVQVIDGARRMGAESVDIMTEQP